MTGARATMAALAALLIVGGRAPARESTADDMSAG